MTAIDVREHPIIFSAPMVRAILEGRKTQTRRPVRPQPPQWLAEHIDSGFRVVRRIPETDLWGAGCEVGGVFSCRSDNAIRTPYGVPGDRLWVRETFALLPTTAYWHSDGIELAVDPGDPSRAAVYREGFDRPRHFPWRPSIHMPRWASRITLEVTAVKVERLRDMCTADAIAEGIDITGDPSTPLSGQDCRHVVSRFAVLWDTIYAAKGHPWSENPWVWVVEFKRIE